MVNLPGSPGCFIDAVNMTLSLPPHQENRFKDIPAGISYIQKRIFVDKWLRLLWDICLMDIELPGDRGLFRYVQEATGGAN